MAPAIGRGVSAPFSHKSIGFKYLDLPGTSGDYASTPDSAAASIAGDIDIRAKVALADWSSASDQALIGKWGSGTSRSYYLRADSTGRVRLFWTPDGTATNSISEISTAAVGFGDGEVGWVRAAMDVDDGSGNRVIKFYTSEDGITWVQLGTTIITVGTTSIFDGTDSVTIGQVANAIPATGRIYHAQVYNGIDGTLAVDFNAQDADVGDTSFVSVKTGETWTINGAAAIERL
jgi:hypothetical protein